MKKILDYESRFSWACPKPNNTHQSKCYKVRLVRLSPFMFHLTPRRINNTRFQASDAMWTKYALF